MSGRTISASCLFRKSSSEFVKSIEYVRAGFVCAVDEVPECDAEAELLSDTFVSCCISAWPTLRRNHMALSMGTARCRSMSRFLSVGLSAPDDMPPVVAEGLGAVDVPAPYVPTPLEMWPMPPDAELLPVDAAEEEGLLGMFLESLESGTLGLASSEYQFSSRVALNTTREGGLYVHGLSGNSMRCTSVGPFIANAMCGIPSGPYPGLGTMTGLSCCQGDVPVATGRARPGIGPAGLARDGASRCLRSSTAATRLERMGKVGPLRSFSWMKGKMDAASP